RLLWPRYTPHRFSITFRSNLISSNRRHQAAKEFRAHCGRLRSFAALTMNTSFVDIHCHLLPGIDDGAKDWDDSLAMAGLAVSEGIDLVVVTPHQLGNYGQNRGDAIRQHVNELQQRLDAARIPLKVRPGADVRIEPGMCEGLVAGDV